MALHVPKGIIATMIPLCLRLSGFLSYRDPVEINFTTFDLACISGPNGAGKSTLLDALTWVLFGQARKRDDALVNLQSKAADVSLTFSYEGAIYRVQRTLTRGKTGTLEFQIQRPNVVPSIASQSMDRPTDAGAGPEPTEEWRPLTERTLRETQARIESILRLDYDTFVNASFFLQGKADQFAQQSPARRKEVLSSILGLESWDEYRSRTWNRRRALEEEVAAIEGRRAEIAAELAEEMPRRARLESLETQLSSLAETRRSQEAAVESVRRMVAALDQQRHTVAALRSAYQRARSQSESVDKRLSERESVRQASAGFRERAEAIRAKYAAWQQARSTLENWDALASSFREQELRRRPFLESIAAERARLEEEERALSAEKEEIEQQETSIKALKGQLEGARSRLAEDEGRIAERDRIQGELVAAREAQAGAKAENEALRPEMDALRSRIDALSSAQGATCPLCGQHLSAAHRKATLKTLQAEGKERGDRFRANKASTERLVVTIARLETQVTAFSGLQEDHAARTALVAQIGERLAGLQAVARAWSSGGLKRLVKVRESLEGERFALDARRQLKALDKELTRLGYDAAAHDAARQLESELREADQEQRGLETALASIEPLENEIRNLRGEVANRRKELVAVQADLEAAQASLDAAAKEAPSLDEAERKLFGVHEQLNALNRDIGAARQKVAVLDDLRARDAEFGSNRQALALQIGRYKVLERAFGKDGVPALLIEQALPEIEAKANELLDRLSDGRMSVRFVTQAGYKDRKREDMRETLDIQISDGAGVRDYELYSGGEAFRINFAVRLALSEVLAARKGARLQTLVIDEGFGSQDDQGRQRLLEAINLVKADFALVLVITHLEQLKDAFPTRIEIEKTEAGSRARIM